MKSLKKEIYNTSYEARRGIVCIINTHVDDQVFLYIKSITFIHETLWRSFYNYILDVLQ